MSSVRLLKFFRRFSAADFHEHLPLTLDLEAGLAGVPVLSMVTHISTDIDFRLVSDGEMESAFSRRAQAVIVRKQLARVLADKVEQGQFNVNEALGVARQILFDAPQSLLGMKPRGN